MFKKILIPTDGSEYSIRAAEYAKWIAYSSGAEILVLNVYETSSLSPIRSRDLKKDMKELWKDDAQKSLDSVLNILNSEGEKLKIDTQINEGRPAETILQSIEDDNIDLVVIGSSGKHAINRFLMGSVAGKVVRSAKSPVMLVH